MNVCLAGEYIHIYIYSIQGHITLYSIQEHIVYTVQKK